MTFKILSQATSVGNLKCGSQHILNKLGNTVSCKTYWKL